ncbi:MAG: hypothetical protein NZM31_12345 [Gemmatales bacterium]|nr:hypothetical protein [Gemmatales bacterium]MDW8387784.1 hypothetical protein [Gemmatales bacterium]
MPLRVFCLLIVIASIGCTKGPQRADPVDPDKARNTLRVVLDAWKKGEKASALQQRQPPIVVQDMDWETGFQLMDYQVLGPDRAEDANLFCPVKLVLRGPDGEISTKEVTYIVGTSPRLTVFRSLY